MDCSVIGDVKSVPRLGEDLLRSDSEVCSDASQNCEQKYIFNINQRAQFSISSPDRKRGLSSIIDNLRLQRSQCIGSLTSPDLPVTNSGDIGFLSKRNGDMTPEPAPTENVCTKSTKHRRRMDKPQQNGQNYPASSVTPTSFHITNNNVKNERLSPGTPDNSSNSGSVTPSSAGRDPDTSPAPEATIYQTPNRYSDFMRSLAARYQTPTNNNTATNDYFGMMARNGYPHQFDTRLRPSFPGLLPSPFPPVMQQPSKDDASKKNDIPNFLSTLTNGILPHIIDMSSTNTLMTLAKTAREAEIQNLKKCMKRPDPTSPLDLSAAAPLRKRIRTKTASLSNPTGICLQKRSESESPSLQEDISSWTVDDVCNFVSSIDICAEYAQTFREQKIDGTGLPLLTEEHLTTTINMKLGPALKLKSILAKKFGSSGAFSHCSHCHVASSGSSDPGTTGNASDSGGNS